MSGEWFSFWRVTTGTALVTPVIKHSDSSVGGIILQWSSTSKMSIELIVTTRHCRDMTEKLLKVTLNQNKLAIFTLLICSLYPFLHRSDIHNRQWRQCTVKKVKKSIFLRFRISSIYTKSLTWPYGQQRLHPCGVHQNALLDLHAYLSNFMTKPAKWHLPPVKTQISLGIRQSDQSLLSAWRKLRSLATVY